MAVSNQGLCPIFYVNADSMLASPKMPNNLSLLRHTYRLWHLLEPQIRELAGKCDFRSRGWRVNRSYRRDYQRELFPTMASATFFHTFATPLFADSNRPVTERYFSMFIAAASVIGTNLYDFLMRILGSEVMRTFFSFLIRQALIRVGL